MKNVECRTQAELDAALKDPNVWPILRGDGVFEVSGSATVRASGSATVQAWDSANTGRVLGERITGQPELGCGGASNGLGETSSR